MDIINDMFDGHIEYENDIEQGQPKEYYIGKAEYILSNLENENYYEFMKVICRNFNQLDKSQQANVKEIMGIKDNVKIIEKEKIIYREKKVQKPKGYSANYDDY